MKLIDSCLANVYGLKIFFYWLRRHLGKIYYEFREITTLNVTLNLYKKMLVIASDFLFYKNVLDFAMDISYLLVLNIHTDKCYMW